jgi:hypothetical protein
MLSLHLRAAGTQGLRKHLVSTENSIQESKELSFMQAVSIISFKSDKSRA